MENDSNSKPDIVTSNTKPAYDRIANPCSLYDETLHLTKHNTVSITCSPVLDRLHSTSHFHPPKSMKRVASAAPPSPRSAASTAQP